MIVATPTQIQELQIALNLVAEQVDVESDLWKKLHSLGLILSSAHTQLSVYGKFTIYDPNIHIIQKGGTDGTNQGTETGSNSESST